MEDIFILEDEQEDYSQLPLKDKIARSIEIIRLASKMSWEFYGKGFICCYSGGKDSDVLLNLCERALPLDKFEVLNSHTTVDAPETVYHIRETVDRINRGGGTASISYPHDKDGNPITMWNLIPQKNLPPTRTIRYCCTVLKETSTPNRMAVLGVRSAESVKRQGRDVFGVRGGTYREATFFSLDHTSEVFRESLEIKDDVWDCTLIKSMKKHGSTVVSPLYDWQDHDIWDYIKQENIKINPLYSEGYERVGCIGCPLAKHRERLRDFQKYPAYKRNYIKAFERMIDKWSDETKAKRKKMQTGQDVFDWWIEKDKYEMKGQMSIDDYV